MDVVAIMTKAVATLPPDASLNRAIALMDEHKVRHLPIVKDDTLLGIVSDRDVLEATGWMPLDSDWETGATPARTVGDVMHEPKTASPQDRLVSMSLELIIHGVGCMPVLDEGKLVGIVTETDLLSAYVESARAGLLTGDFDPLVSTLMTRVPSTIAPSETLQKAREMMKSISTHHLPVVDGERVIGMLSDRDLRWATGRETWEDTPIEDFMADFVVSVDSPTKATDAAQRMLECRISSLPVIDDDKLVGILTTSDLLVQCMDTLWEPEVAS